MPASAGRVRMAPDNRLSVSDSLRTTEIWQKSVGYDPYAPTQPKDSFNSNDQIDDKAKGLFALARLTGSSSSTTPGACRKCNQVGHLTFQCRNYISLKGSTASNQTSFPLINESDEKLNKDKHGDVKQKHRRRHRPKRRHSCSSSSSDNEQRKARRKKKRRSSRSSSETESAASDDDNTSTSSSSSRHRRHRRDRGRCHRTTADSAKRRHDCHGTRSRSPLPLVAGSKRFSSTSKG